MRCTIPAAYFESYSMITVSSMERWRAAQAKEREEEEAARKQKRAEKKKEDDIDKVNNLLDEADGSTDGVDDKNKEKEKKKEFYSGDQGAPE